MNVYTTNQGTIRKKDFIHNVYKVKNANSGGK